MDLKAREIHLAQNESSGKMRTKVMNISILIDEEVIGWLGHCQFFFKNSATLFQSDLKHYISYDC